MSGILYYNFVSENNRISLIKKYTTKKKLTYTRHSRCMIGNYRYYYSRYYSYKNEYRFEKWGDHTLWGSLEY